MKHALLMFMIIALCTALPAEDITVDKGKTVGYFPSVPNKSKSNGKLCIVMPGGPMTKDIANGWKRWAEEFAKRGYHSATLYTNFGPLISYGPQQNHQYIDKAIDALKAKYKITEEKVLLVGCSNGGTASFQYAQSNPTETLGIIAAPGQFPGGKLTDIPVLFLMGEKDELGWAEQYDMIVNALKASGATLTSELLNGKRHTFDLEWGKVDKWLKTLK